MAGQTVLAAVDGADPDDPDLTSIPPGRLALLIEGHHHRLHVGGLPAHDHRVRPAGRRLGDCRIVGHHQQRDATGPYRAGSIGGVVEVVEAAVVGGGVLGQQRPADIHLFSQPIEGIRSGIGIQPQRQQSASVGDHVDTGDDLGHHRRGPHRRAPGDHPQSHRIRSGGQRPEQRVGLEQQLETTRLTRHRAGMISHPHRVEPACFRPPGQGRQALELRPPVRVGRRVGGGSGSCNPHRGSRTPSVDPSTGQGYPAPGLTSPGLRASTARSKRSMNYPWTVTNPTDASMPASPWW